MAKLVKVLIDVEARGRNGGKSRANNMTPEQRQEAARAAANARWHPSTKPLRKGKANK